MKCCARTLSGQEERILNNKEVMIEGRERSLKLLRKLKDCPITMDVARARYFTESFIQTEGWPLSLRWALALKNIAENIPVFIEEDELIVGHVSSKFGRNGVLYPELEGPALLEIRGSEKRIASPYSVSEEDLEYIENTLYPYWSSRSFAQVYADNLPKETRRIIFGNDPKNSSKQTGITIAASAGRSSIAWCYDYKSMFDMGIQGMHAKAEEMLLQAKKEPAMIALHGAYWEATLITLEAFTVFIKRYGVEAERLAQSEQNISRKQELELISSNCFWIAENPPRTFKETLQLEWFINIFGRLEQNIGAGLGLGRMDQLLYPYYVKDIEENKLTKQEAKEWLESFWIAMAQIPPLFSAVTAGNMHDGYAQFNDVTLGGQTADGCDATNELSYLILESKRGLPTIYPDFIVRIHAGTPDEYLKFVCEIIKDGQGFPKILNDEEIIPLYVAKGEKLEDAYNYATNGCIDPRLVNRESYINPCGYQNAAIVVEWALHDGRVASLNNERYGLATGDPRDFKTFDDFFAAVQAQYEYLCSQSLTQQAIADIAKSKALAAPFQSIMSPVCWEAGVDMQQFVPGSLAEQFLDQVGLATIIDSIAAVKKLVYDDKVLTMEDIVKAIDANFEGYEVIQQMMLNAPKFGLNDPYVDNIGKELDKIVWNYLDKHRGVHGEFISARWIPITNHIYSGKIIGATPNGRKAGEFLSEGSAASQGCEITSPTTLLLSNRNIKNMTNPHRNGRLLNIKFSPASVAGEMGTRKLMSFIRTWCDLRIWHAQFNIVNADTLKAAQQEPENYKDLIVRVAGYSAFFVDLSEQLQNEIIARSELEM